MRTETALAHTVTVAKPLVSSFLRADQIIRLRSDLNEECCQRQTQTLQYGLETTFRKVAFSVMSVEKDSLFPHIMMPNKCTRLLEFRKQQNFIVRGNIPTCLSPFRRMIRAASLHCSPPDELVFRGSGCSHGHCVSTSLVGVIFSRAQKTYEEQALDRAECIVEAFDGVKVGTLRCDEQRAPPPSPRFFSWPPNAGGPLRISKVYFPCAIILFFLAVTS